MSLDSLILQVLDLLVQLQSSSLKMTTFTQCYGMAKGISCTRNLEVVLFLTVVWQLAYNLGMFTTVFLCFSDPCIADSVFAECCVAQLQRRCRSARSGSLRDLRALSAQECVVLPSLGLRSVWPCVPAQAAPPRVRTASGWRPPAGLSPARLLSCTVCNVTGHEQAEEHDSCDELPAACGYLLVHKLQGGFSVPMRAGAVQRDVQRLLAQREGSGSFPAVHTCLWARDSSPGAFQAGGTRRVPYGPAFRSPRT